MIKLVTPFQQISNNQTFLPMLNKEILQAMLDALREIAGETTCMICYQQFNMENKKPILICLEQHNCCSECIKLVKRCPLCWTDFDEKMIAKNRLLCSLLQQIQATKRKIDLHEKLQELQSQKMNFAKKRLMKEMMGQQEQNRLKETKIKKFQIRKVQTSMGCRNKVNSLSSSLLMGR